MSGSIFGTHVGTLQEFIEPNVLNLAPNANSVEFGIAGGNGKFQLSDVALHYRREI